MMKVAIIGPESSGKSVLTQQLSDHFGGHCIPEYARTYLENRIGDYTIDDVNHIAQQQFKAINECINTNDWMFCDTELYVIELWTQEVFEQSIPWVKDALNEQLFDYYLLCTPDLPWTPDPLRETPDKEERKRYFEWFKKRLKNDKKPFGVVSGLENERLTCAISHLNHT